MNSASNPSNAGAMYRALVGIGCVCAVLIVSAYLLTQPVIARKQAERLQQAVFRVLPGTQRIVALSWGDDGPLRPSLPRENVDLYLGLGDQGRLRGVAIPASGMGYQDHIRLLYGYAPHRHQIVGLQVLESRETPGLGDRIMHDAAFLAAFSALDVQLREDGDQLLHPVQVAEPGQQRHPWEIDGITGATISSRAVASILDASCLQWLPRIQRSRTELAEIGTRD